MSIVFSLEIFYSFNEQTPSSSFNGGETQKSLPQRGAAESVLPQRSNEVMESLGDSDLEIDEADCLPETDTKSQFVTAEDSFGRIRRLRIGSSTANRVQERDRLREKRLEQEREAAFQAERRPVASYEDI
jgi:hypothetical protein